MISLLGLLMFKVTMAEEEKPAINVEKAEKEQKEEDEGESSEEELGNYYFLSPLST